MSYGVQGIAFDETLNVQQYRLLVVLTSGCATCAQCRSLPADGVTEQADFRVVGPVSATIAREETALSQAAAEIARSIVSLAIDRF